MSEAEEAIMLDHKSDESPPFHLLFLVLSSCGLESSALVERRCILPFMTYPLLREELLFALNLNLPRHIP